MLGLLVGAVVSSFLIVALDMAGVLVKYVAPTTDETAFNCPHCSALAQQDWFNPFVSPIETPKGVTPQSEYEAFFDSRINRMINSDPSFTYFAQVMMDGAPALFNAAAKPSQTMLMNVHFSQCYRCKHFAVWVGRILYYPTTGEAPEPNPDLPDDILADYREASAILALSPRGSSALIRLCIQKLCQHLGLPGKNINEDIATLVLQGLDVKIQRALDAVRVIGNNAVHPGAMDLTDDRPIAESLFRLLNLISEKMISEPKHVDDVYSLTPPSALAAIEKRDGKGK